MRWYAKLWTATTAKDTINCTSPGHSEASSSISRHAPVSQRKEETSSILLISSLALNRYPKSSGARDTGHFLFLLLLLNANLLSSEAHSALFFLYENYCIVVLFQRGHHSSKNQEWGEAGTPSSKLSPGAHSLARGIDPISDRNSMRRMRI